MKLKTSELQGPALDWAVAKCEELEVYFEDGLVCLVGQPFDTYWKYWNSTTDWSQGGPIIEREGISVLHTTMRPSHAWEASHTPDEDLSVCEFGPTPLVAAMRCYVASKLGDEVEVPNELEGEKLL